MSFFNQAPIWNTSDAVGRRTRSALQGASWARHEQITQWLQDKTRDMGKVPTESREFTNIGDVASTLELGSIEAPGGKFFHKSAMVRFD